MAANNDQATPAEKEQSFAKCKQARNPADGQSEPSSFESENDRLKAGQKAQSIETAKTQEGELSESDKDFWDNIPCPDLNDYKGNFPNHEKDYDLWLNGKPLMHNPKGYKPPSEGETQTSPATESQSTEGEAPEQEFSAENQILQMLVVPGDDFEEMLDSSDSIDDEIRDSFQEMVDSEKIRLTKDMLEWLMDNPDDAPMVVSYFVEKPVVSRYIVRKPESQRLAMLQEVADLAKAEPAKKEQKSQPNFPDTRSKPGSNPSIAAAAEDDGDIMGYLKQREKDRPKYNLKGVIGIFKSEFSFIESKFKVHILDIEKVESSTIQEPGVYIFWHPELGVIKVGKRSEGSVTERALDHIRDNTRNDFYEMKNIKDDKGIKLMCITLNMPRYLTISDAEKRQFEDWRRDDSEMHYYRDAHWLLSIEAYMEWWTYPLIPAGRVG